LSEIDYRSALWMAENFGADAAAAGLGRFKLTLGDETNWTETMRGTRHHIGTTRMAEGALEGVVDRNCKVFGMANLFVAGSSVFSTCGKGSPTLAIIALAERLADHVMERFS
jgi:choline dehydrogenase-like flavoprotein